MGIGVHVKEFTGEVVARPDAPIDVNRLCTLAAEDPARYPLLSGVDEYDDTYFNTRQSLHLAYELEMLAAAHHDAELRQTAQSVLRLIDLLRPAPGRAHHRQLVFIGD